jgi:mono/diheme cytochrome c family protein
LRRSLCGRGYRVARTAALATLVICAGALACSRPAPAAARTPADAPALFAQACAKCHAADGTGGLPMAANGLRPTDLTSADWHRTRTDAELVDAIRSGRGAMPPFADVLTADQIAALAAHLRTLKRPSQ